MEKSSNVDVVTPKHYGVISQHYGVISWYHDRICFPLLLRFMEKNAIWDSGTFFVRNTYLGIPMIIVILILWHSKKNQSAKIPVVLSREWWNSSKDTSTHNPIPPSTSKNMAQETVGHARFSECRCEQCADGDAKIVQDLPVASALEVWGAAGANCGIPDRFHLNMGDTHHRRLIKKRQKKWVFDLFSDKRKSGWSKCPVASKWSFSDKVRLLVVEMGHFEADEKHRKPWMVILEVSHFRIPRSINWISLGVRIPKVENWDQTSSNHRRHFYYLGYT